MACCYIAAACIAQLIKACQFLDIDETIRYNDDENDEKLTHGATLDCSESPSEPQSTTSAVLSLSGLTCQTCVETVERALSELEDVQEARVSLPMQQATVVAKSDRILDSSRLVSAVHLAGYDATVGPRSHSEFREVLQSKAELSELKESFSGLVVYASLVQTCGYAEHYIGDGGGYMSVQGITVALLRVLSLFLAVYCQYHHALWIHRDSWKLARSGNANMNSLISLSAILGLSFTLIDMMVHGPLAAVSYSLTTTGLTLVVVAGRYLEVLTRRDVSRHMANLYGSLSNFSYVKLYPSQQIVPSTFIRKSDTIILDPFSKVPCDCYVIQGHSQVNQAIVTGESKPIPKSPGDFILAGTRNLHGGLICVVHKEPEDSFYAQLVRSVTNATTQKLKGQETLGFITRYFVYGVILLAVVAPMMSALSKPVSFDNLYHQVRELVHQAMTILASACPCALGLAAPSAVVAAIDAAQKKGVILTNGASTIQDLSVVDSLVFDKTGTLTTGTLEVDGVELHPNWGGSELVLWTLVCAVEEYGAQGHPVGTAIFKKGIQQLGSHWLDFKREGVVDNTESSAGGVCGRVAGCGTSSTAAMCVGSCRFLEEHGVVDMPQHLHCRTNAGLSVHVAVDGKYIGSISLQDRIRTGAKQTIRGLTSMGHRSFLLTGDSKTEAERVSKALEIPLLGFEATPDKKLSQIRRLQELGLKVAMIGDGLNDAPSLAAANVGVILAHNSSIATVGGSVMILNANLNSLPIVMEMTRQTMKQVRLNVAWAAIYNIAALSLATGLVKIPGLVMTPSLGAAFMSASSVLITLNSMRLRGRLENINAS